MKKALINVPVQVNIWIRRECQLMQFEMIKKARPSILFLQSDGGRNEVEWKAIYENRRLYDEGIDWDCAVYKLYEKENNGLYAMLKKTADLVWSKVDRCIFLEDDVLPTISFFFYCAELLERYKDDLRIHYVTGLNYKGIYDKPEADYFFCGEGCIWGFATWKRTFISQNLEYAKSEYVKNCINNMIAANKKGYERYVNGYASSKVFDGHVAGPEFYKNLLRFSQNQLCIVPSKNLISNIGIGKGSAHSSDNIRKLPKAVQKLFYMKTYELNNPMIHPDFVVRDIEYDKFVDRTLAWGHPVISLSRKIERVIRCFIYGDINKVKKGLRNQFIKAKEK